MADFPRVLFSAPGSSSGKTVASLLFTAWAEQKGLAPRAFKCGPDFIDPQFLSLASRRETPALDPWFLSEEKLRGHFARWASPRLNVIEGVMGLYDGKRAEAFGSYSTATVAKVLDAPVVLVLDARKAGQSLAAQALGLIKADPKVRVAGVILNRVFGPKAAAFHAPHLRSLCGLPILGWLPTLKELALPERHLGLTALSELKPLRLRLEAALAKAALGAGFERILRVARSAREMKAPAPGRLRKPKLRFVLALARDQAFHFYYPENLRALEDAGAELAFFSPLKDSCLPAGASGLMIGGGFPESFGAALAKNRALHREVRAAVGKGLPTWAECGGLMWLGKGLRNLDGRRQGMVGALDVETEMSKGLQDFGYVRVQGKPGKGWASGLRFRGHEFHHSRALPGPRARTAWQLFQSGRQARVEGYALPGGVATYVHAYFPAARLALSRFVKACLNWQAASRVL